MNLKNVFFSGYFIFALFMIDLFSTKKFEWMLQSGDIQSICEIPSEDGCYFNLFVVFLVLPALLIKNKKIAFSFIAISICYALWRFYIRFTGC